MTHSESTASFGYWVRRRRLALDMTQADLARAVGCATVTISKLERDERRPSRQMAGLLADRLAIPVEARAGFLAGALGERSADRMALSVEPLDTSNGKPVPTNLPVPSTPFVGRRHELEQITARLADPACRLLTLAGPGGFGKTRLAIRLGEIARTQPARFANGIFFVALDRLENSNLIVPAIATALEFTFYEKQDQASQLLDYLADKELLLILDNAEDFLDPILVANVLEAAPAVKVVVTSRVALRLQQEWYYPVGGMTVGELENHADDEAPADAVALFQQSAQRVRPDFDLAQTRPYVQQICRLADGAPLAIELAAAWVKSLSCEQVARELEASIDLLASSLRNIPERHRSVSAVLEKSWRYLSDEEQRVFRQLSVFAGGFSADAAQRVTDASLWTLAGLVDKSMLQLTQDGRYRIHTLLQQLGAAKLALHDQEATSVQARQRDFFMAFLADRRHAIMGQEQRDALSGVQQELDNIVVAWQSAARTGRGAAFGQSLPTLFHFLWVRGRYAEGEQLLAAALNAFDSAQMTQAESAIRSVMQARRAQLIEAQGRQAESLALLADTLAIAQQAEDLPGQALCWYLIGVNHADQRNRTAALASLARAHALYWTLADAAGIASAALELGHAHIYLAGDYKAGEPLIEEGLRFARESGDLANITMALDRNASVRWKLGDFAGSEAYYQECLTLARTIEHRHLIASATGGLGLVAWGRDEMERAIELFQARLDQMQELGRRPEVATSLFLLSGIYAHYDRGADAARLLERYADFPVSYFKIQAQIVAGKFEDALRHLPEQTQAMLDAGNTYDLAACLVAWAMLLMRDYPLSLDDTASPRDLPDASAGRRQLAYAILLFVAAYERCRADTRAHAARLLAELNRAGAASASDAGQLARGDYAIEELAEAVLAL